MKPESPQYKATQEDTLSPMPDGTLEAYPSEPPPPRATFLWKCSTGILAAVVVLGGGAIFWQSLRADPPAAQNAPGGPPPRPVETIPIEAGTGARSVVLLGQVESSEQATIRAQVDGIVEEVLVKEGDRVSAGEVIAIIDDADRRVSVAQAQARLTQERSNLEELEVGTRQEVLDQRQAELQAANAREREARDNLRHLRELSPSRIAQRQAELQSARAREQETKDNLVRIQTLVSEGALSDRILIEARTAADAAVGDRLGAESALTAERTEIEQAIAAAEATIDETVAERLRLEALLAEAQAGPRREVIDAQRSVVDSAQAVVAEAQLGLDRTQVTALSDGVVRSREVSLGDYVETSDPILTLVNEAAVDIFLEVPEQLASQVRPGMTVALTARALDNWQQSAPIDGVVPATDPSSRRQFVRITLNDPPESLLPGMAIRADLKLPIKNAPKEGSFIVPRDALTRRGDRWLAYTVQDGQAREHNVELVADMGTEMAIAHPDLRPGQQIVVQGGDGLKDGAAVKVVSEEGE